MSDRSTGPGPFFNASESEFNLNQGWENTEVYEGTEAECRAKQAVLISAGANRVKISPKGDGAWTVRATFPFITGAPVGNYVDTMELEVNAVGQAWERSPVYRSQFSDYVSSTGTSARAVASIGIVGDLNRKFQSGKPDQVTTAGANLGKFLYLTTAYNTRESAIFAEANARFALIPITGAELVLAQALLYQVLWMRVTSFLEYQQVFRRTVTAGSPQAIQSNQVGVGKIWTSAEVVSWEGIPSSGGWFVLPSGKQWHKDKPRVLSVFGQKTQLTYSYTEIVSASGLFYQAYGNAALLY